MRMQRNTFQMKRSKKRYGKAVITKNTGDGSTKFEYHKEMVFKYIENGRDFPS